MNKCSLEFVLGVLKPVIDKLGITVTIRNDLNGGYAEIEDKEIILGAKTEVGNNAYMTAHEIGHIACGFGCCREHREFEAHGVAKFLCKMYDLPLGEGEESINDMAGITEVRDCRRARKNVGDYGWLNYRNLCKQHRLHL